MLNIAQRHLLQLGFASAISPDNFARPNLDLAVAIDVSGSMSGDKLDTAKLALHEVVDQLGPKDHMSLVSYGSSARVVQRMAVEGLVLRSGVE